MKKKVTEEVVESENQTAAEQSITFTPTDPLPSGGNPTARQELKVDPFDALLAAVNGSLPPFNADPETKLIPDHHKPAETHNEACNALEAYVQAETERLGPDHPEVERKRRLMNMAFR